MSMPKNTQYTMSTVPWWEPVKYGTDLIRDYGLRNIEEFPFVQTYRQPIKALGTERDLLRPTIGGVYIHVPVPAEDYTNPYTKIGHKLGGMWIDLENKMFALHTEWWYERAQAILARNPVYKQSEHEHWVENTYFRRDPDSEVWLPLNPTGDELESVRLWAIMEELAN